MHTANQPGLLAYLLDQSRRSGSRPDAPARVPLSSLRRITARLMIRIGTWLDPELSQPGQRLIAQGLSR
jgi:hypothetical protein